MDDALDVWISEACVHDISISGPIPQAKTQELATELGHTDFKCSNGWLRWFKTRKGIGFCTIKREAKAVKPEAMDAWKNTLLPKLLEDYSSDDIYNTHETGLIYKQQPKKSLVTVDLWPLPLPLNTMMTLMMIESLCHAGMEVSTEDEAVYNTVNNSLLTAVTMTVQDIAKGGTGQQGCQGP